MNDQPLTEAEEAVARVLASGDWEAGVRNCDIGTREDVAQYARDIVAALFATAPCPTCSGPTRETTHMICMECGTDYASGPPQKIPANAFAVLRAGLDEVKRLRAENEVLGTEAANQCQDSAARTVRAEKDRDRFVALADKLADTLLALTARPRPQVRAEDRIRALRKLADSQKDGTQQ